MLAIDIEQGLTDAWTRIATFVPKLLGFILILVVGYLIAKLVERLVDALLERVGFDRWVERGSLRDALARSRFDASDILATIAFWTVLLFALQLAFGVFGPNPISDLLFGIITFLPNLFVAIVVLVIAAALAKVVTDLLTATLGTVSGGEWIAKAAGLSILVLGIFMALSQLQIAPAIVNALFYAMLAIIVGSAVVAVGGGGIRTMQRYWERAAVNLEAKDSEIRREVDAQTTMPVTIPESDQTQPMRGE
jgi:Conserved TM helix